MTLLFLFFLEMFFVNCQTIVAILPLLLKQAIIAPNKLIGSQHYKRLKVDFHCCVISFYVRTNVNFNCLYVRK